MARPTPEDDFMEGVQLVGALMAANSRDLSATQDRIAEYERDRARKLLKALEAVHLILARVPDFAKTLPILDALDRIDSEMSMPGVQDLLGETRSTF